MAARALRCRQLCCHESCEFRLWLRVARGISHSLSSASPASTRSWMRYGLRVFINEIIEIMKFLPSNFRRLVLFCTDSYDSESRRILQHFSRSNEIYKINNPLHFWSRSRKILENHSVDPTEKEENEEKREKATTRKDASSKRGQGEKHCPNARTNNT